MPEFAYTARTLSGENVAGSIVAASKRETLSVLAERSLYPLRVESSRKANSRWQPKKRISPQLLAANLTQLADLLQNGVPVLNALAILAEQATHPGLAEVLGNVRDRIADGTSLEEAFGAHPQAFNELTISMVRAGAEGAFLEDALKRTADFMEMQEELKSRFVGAMYYPAFLAAVGSIVTLVLIVFFVPKFAELFTMLERQGGGLPLATVVLLGLSDVLGRYGLVLALVAAGLVYWLRKLAATDRGRLLVDRWKLKIPVAGKIFLGYAVSRFCRILGTLLKNGVPILQSLKIAKDATGNIILSEAIGEAAENISEGKALARPLAASGWFPEEVVEMIAVGEEANNLEQVLIDVAESMERRTNRLLDMFVRLLEPILLTFMGGVVLFVVVALLWPILQSSNAL